MRSNLMKTCAVGAMLFGGVLGASSTASAGLVWQAELFGMENDRTLMVANASSGWADTAYRMDAFGESESGGLPVTIIGCGCGSSGNHFSIR